MGGSARQGHGMASMKREGAIRRVFTDANFMSSSSPVSVNR